MNAVAWRPRDPPLPPLAMAVRGEGARRLARRLLDTDRFATYEGVVCGDLLLLLGPDLPWIQGCVYLGREPRVPSLFTPTALSPSVAVELLERALARQFVGLERPLAILPGADAVEVVALGGARQLGRTPLEAWLDG